MILSVLSFSKTCWTSEVLLMFPLGRVAEEAGAAFGWTLLRCGTGGTGNGWISEFLLCEINGTFDPGR